VPLIDFPILISLCIVCVFLEIQIDSFAAARDNDMHEATRRMLSVLLRQVNVIAYCFMMHNDILYIFIAEVVGLITTYNFLYDK
jgi:hypothetical protein